MVKKMIFVTVGTHEQQFERLLKCIDEMNLEEKVIVQSGYTDYQFQNCEAQKLLPYSQMVENVKNARIVITHGGPSSIMMPLQIGKIPIVVPRQKKFNEHVNDHQLEFVKKISENGSIIPVYDIEKLEGIIQNYEQLSSQGTKWSGHNQEFVQGLERIVQGLFEKG